MQSFKRTYTFLINECKEHINFIKFSLQLLVGTFHQSFKYHRAAKSKCLTVNQCERPLISTSISRHTNVNDLRSGIPTLSIC